MSKPTSEELKRTIDTDLDAAALDQMIDDAELMGGDCIDQYGDSRRKAIIRWLAAHLIASGGIDGALQSESLGDASESYARPQLGDALRGTTYGQQALSLDTKGCLSRVGKPKASIQVV